MGALNNLVPFSLIFWSQTQIASGLAAILNATTPLWTVLLAHFLTRDERRSARRAAGVALGFAGVVVIVGPAALRGLGADALAQFAVVLGALSYACAGIFGRGSRSTRENDPRGRRPGRPGWPHGAAGRPGERAARGPADRAGVGSD